MQTFLASDFLGSLGVNTHIGKVVNGRRTPYADTAAVIKAINYLGVKHVRDCVESDAGVALFKQVAEAAKVTYCLYGTSGAPAWSESSILTFAPKLARHAEFLEGTNEPDGTYSAANGNSMAIAAKLQPRVHALAHSLGLKSIVSAPGAGWQDAQGNYREGGNYGAAGDQSADCDHGNIHGYPVENQTAEDMIPIYHGWARRAAPGRDIIMTEWGNHDGGAIGDISIMPPVPAAIRLWQGFFKAFELGIKRTYAYELFDQNLNALDPESHFGLFWPDGTPKPPANMWRHITGLLKDARPLDGITPLPGTITGRKPNHKLIPLQVTETRYVIVAYDTGLFFDQLAGKYIAIAGSSIGIKLDKAATLTALNPLDGKSQAYGAPAGVAIPLSFSYIPFLFMLDFGGGGPAPAEARYTASDLAAEYRRGRDDLWKDIDGLRTA